MICSSRFCKRVSGVGRIQTRAMTDLEALVLQDLLDRNILQRLGNVQLPRLEYDTKRAIPNDFAVGILDLGLLSRDTIGREYRHDTLGVVIESWGQTVRLIPEWTQEDRMVRACMNMRVEQRAQGGAMSFRAAPIKADTHRACTARSLRLD